MAEPTTSKMAILAIVYRAAKAVGDEWEMTVPEIVSVAEPLAEKIAEMVAMQGGTYTPPTYIAQDLDTYTFIAEILDAVEAHIPLVHDFNVTLTTSRFAERGACEGCGGEVSA